MNNIYKKYKVTHEYGENIIFSLFKYSALSELTHIDINQLWLFLITLSAYQCVRAVYCEQPNCQMPIIS